MSQLFAHFAAPWLRGVSSVELLRGLLCVSEFLDEDKVSDDDKTNDGWGETVVSLVTSSVVSSMSVWVVKFGHFFFWDLVNHELWFLKRGALENGSWEALGVFNGVASWSNGSRYTPGASNEVLATVTVSLSVASVLIWLRNAHKS